MTTIGRLEQKKLIFTTAGTNFATLDASVADTITFTGDAINTVQLKNITDPSDAQDAVTKTYVDSLVSSGISWKESSRLATDGNETGTFTYDGTSIITVTASDGKIDGVEVVNGDRILMKNQALVVGTTPLQSNGIYVVSAFGGTDPTAIFTLTRTDDALATTSATGSAIFIYFGDGVLAPNNNDTTWVVTNDTAVTWNDATTLTFAQMSAAPVLGVLIEDHIFIGNTSGDADDGGTSYKFDYSTRATTPVLSIGGLGSVVGVTSGSINVGTDGAAAVIGNINLGKGTAVSTINFDSTGNNLITSDGALTMNSTSGNLTLQSITSGDVVVTSVGKFIGTGGISSDIDLFNTTTTGTISVGTGLTTGILTLGNSTSTGTVSINNASQFDLGANSTDINIGTVANSTNTEVTGQNVNLGSSTTTNMIVDSISINVGSTETTSLDLLATGVAGAVVLTAGDVTSSGTVNISTVTPTTATVPGGKIDIIAGSGATSGAGGAIDIIAGSGGTTGSGGAVTIDAGSGGTTDSSVGGAIIINSGVSGSTNGDGGDITITSAGKTGTGVNGKVRIDNAGIIFDFPTVQGSINDILTTDATGVTSWTTPGGANMLALPEFQMYVGNSSGIAVVGTDNLIYDDTTAAGSPVLNIGSNASGTSTLNIGTSGNLIGITSDIGGEIIMMATQYNTFLKFGANTDIDVNGGQFRLLNDSGNQIMSVEDSSGTALITSLTDGIIITGSNGDVSLISDSNNVVLDSGGITYTKNGGTMASNGLMTMSATSADLTLSTLTSGNIAINSADQTVTTSTTGTSLDVTAQTLTIGADQANISSSTFQAPTFAGAFTVTDASTVYIKNSPIAGGSTLTNSWALHVASGNVKIVDEVYATAFNATSDVRYKTNIVGLADPLDQINRIEGYSYNWKEDFKGYNDKLQYGVLAQQLEDVGLNHLVSGNEQSKSVNYLGLIPLLIGAVKELSSKVDKYEGTRKTRDRSNW